MGPKILKFALTPFTSLPNTCCLRDCENYDSLLFNGVRNDGRRSKFKKLLDSFNFRNVIYRESEVQISVLWQNRIRRDRFCMGGFRRQK